MCILKLLLLSLFQIHLRWYMLSEGEICMNCIAIDVVKNYVLSINLLVCERDRERKRHRETNEEWHCQYNGYAISYQNHHHSKRNKPKQKSNKINHTQTPANKCVFIYRQATCSVTTEQLIFHVINLDAVKMSWQL